MDVTEEVREGLGVLACQIGRQMGLLKILITGAEKSGITLAIKEVTGKLPGLSLRLRDLKMAS